MSDRKFRYELVSLDQGLWARTKLFFFNKQSLIVHGKYFVVKKALAHLDLLLKQGKNVYLVDRESHNIFIKKDQ